MDCLNITERIDAILADPTKFSSRFNQTHPNLCFNSTQRLTPAKNPPHPDRKQFSQSEAHLTHPPTSSSRAQKITRDIFSPHNAQAPNHNFPSGPSQPLGNMPPQSIKSSLHSKNNFFKKPTIPNPITNKPNFFNEAYLKLQIAKVPSKAEPHTENQKVHLASLFQGIEQTARALTIQRNQSNIINLAAKKGHDQLLQIRAKLEEEIGTIQRCIVLSEQQIQAKARAELARALELNSNLQKENFYLQSKLGNFGGKIQTQIVDQNRLVETNHYQIEEQREIFFVSKNGIDQECAKILKEMQEDFDRNEDLISESLAQTIQEIESKKNILKDSKPEVERFRSEMLSGLKTSEQEIRRLEHDRAIQKISQYQESLKTLDVEISLRDAANKTLESELRRRKDFHRQKQDEFNSEHNH
jgi:hypothetical protein